jgi:hypothetical protein
MVDRHVEHHHGSAAGPCQVHRAGLGDERRTFRPIDGEGDSIPLFQHFAHAEQRGDPAPCAGSANRSKAKLLNNSSYVLSVETLACHDADSQVSPHVYGGEHAAVPKGMNKGTRPKRLLIGPTLFRGNGIPQGRSKQPDGQKSC